MARFRFFLIGSSDAPILELPVDSVRALNEVITRSKFIEGEMDMGDRMCGVLLSVNRIQSVVHIAE